MRFSNRPLVRISNWFFGRRSAGTLCRAAVAAVEQMEARRLLSHAFMDQGGVLHADGTSGDDTTTVYQSAGTIYVSDDSSFLGVSAGNVTIILVLAGAGNDTVTISSTVSKNSSVSGDAGNDSITGGAGIDQFDGGDGADTLDRQAGNDNLTGGAGDDSIRGDADNDTLTGGDGADTLSGGSGTADKADYSLKNAALAIDLDGNADDGAVNENDNVMTDIEQVQGGLGNDVIRGNTATGAANATLWGGDGHDSIIGGKGDDSLDGEGGDDTLSALGDSDGTDTLVAGAGTDVANYSAKSAALTITLDGAGNDGQSGESDNVDIDFDKVYGGSGDDSITGDGDPETLYGNDGVDTLHGEGGNDRLEGGRGYSATHTYQYLYGGAGNDTIFGGEGYGDYLYGETGNDDLWSYGDKFAGYGDFLDGGNEVGDSDTANYDSLDSLTNIESSTLWGF